MLVGSQIENKCAIFSKIKKTLETSELSYPWGRRREIHHRQVDLPTTERRNPKSPRNPNEPKGVRRSLFLLEMIIAKRCSSSIFSFNYPFSLHVDIFRYTEQLQQSRDQAKLRRKAQKEAAKALETPEEKRARRLAKKRAKEEKRRQVYNLFSIFNHKKIPSKFETLDGVTGPELHGLHERRQPVRRHASHGHLRVGQKARKGGRRRQGRSQRAQRPVGILLIDIYLFLN